MAQKAKVHEQSVCARRPGVFFYELDLCPSVMYSGMFSVYVISAGYSLLFTYVLQEQPPLP